MYEELMKWLIEDKSWLEQGHLETEHEVAEHIKQAVSAIESLEHTVEILCGVKINLVRCCECIYHNDGPYHYCRKWRKNCPDDSDFFCKWGERKVGGHDNV